MTLATEQPDTPAPEAHEHVSLLEKWSANERMRHIPSLPWIVDKLDHDLRRRIDLLWNVYANIYEIRHPERSEGSPPTRSIAVSAAQDDGVRADIEKEFRGLCRCLDRVADVAKRMRGNHHNHPPAELGARIRWAINHTVSLLNSVDAETFGHRYPFQTFERSNGEPLWAAMLSVIEHVHRITSLVRPLDPGIDERLYEGLVTLQTPLDPRPIA